MTPTNTTMGSQDSRSKYESKRSYDSSRSRRTAASDGRQSDRSGQHDQTQSQTPNDSFASRARSSRSRSRSPTKRSRSPDKAPPIPHSSTAGSTLSDRRHQTRPRFIDVDSARQYGSVSKKTVVVDAQHQHQHQHRPHHAAVVAPATPPLRRMPRIMSPTMSESGDDDSSSYYSEEEFGQAHPTYISPLRVRKASDNNTSPLRSYNNWGRSPSPQQMPQDGFLAARSPHRRGLQKTATTGDLRHEDPPQTPRNYSPLSDYLTNRAKPVRKELVGKNGWLERTTTSPDKKLITEQKEAAPPPPPQQQQQQQKKRGFLTNLKKLAKEMTTSASAITASASRKPREEQRFSRMTVSLDPREQSLLYCELEFLLTTALDAYISSQFNAGRLDADKYKKVVDGWLARGRPKVVGFRYDLETQLDLVLLHGEDFRFYGKRAGLLAAVNGVLDMMRVDARAMRIRTFCQPDTVVAKQLLDAQSLFNLIGCCEQQQIQLAEVIQFFKVILEREQNYRRGEVVGQPGQEDPQWRGSGNSGDTGTDSQPKKSHSTKASNSPANYGST